LHATAVAVAEKDSHHCILLSMWLKLSVLLSHDFEYAIDCLIKFIITVFFMLFVASHCLITSLCRNMVFSRFRNFRMPCNNFKIISENLVKN